MRYSRLAPHPGAVLLALFLAAGCNRTAPAPEPSGTVVTIGDEEFRISGPYAHDNVSVFLVHADKQADGDFITLDEGLKVGTVKVTEKEQEQVGELRIDNQSDSPLFLQEGDRIQGGKQDRTIISSMVVPPKSGPTALPSMCIEHSRWVYRGGNNREFAATENAALAPLRVRYAAKVAKDQGRVWAGVAMQKAEASEKLAAKNTNSSLNEALDSPEVKKLSDACAAALKGVLEEHPDAVGVVVAVNGKIEEVNVYPNHKLLTKLYPRLLQSYAFQAALEKDKAADVKAVDHDAVVRFLQEAREKEREADKVDARNELRIREGKETVECRTQYQGQAVHVQVAASPAD
jgi:hypothetical protein